MSRGTIHRTVRIEDGLWTAAKTKAEAEGVSLSDVIRAALRSYVDGGTTLADVIAQRPPVASGASGCS